MVNFFYVALGETSPQTDSCPLEEKSPASYCCLEILAHVEVYRFFYPLNRDIFIDSHYKMWWWCLSCLFFLWDIIVPCHWRTGAENSGQCSCPIVKGQMSNEHENWMYNLCRWHHCATPKHGVPVTRWHSRISQNNGDLNCTAVKVLWNFLNVKPLLFM
jgi:hypothetical protein